jgi:hypothetical protein
MEDPENIDSIYFTDYFGNKIRLGQIGLYRSYDPTDYIGMSKSCAMDIAEEQIQTLVINTQPFNSWYNNRHKFFTLYTAVDIYLYNENYDTPQLVKDWFRELYIMKTIEYR